MFLPFPPRSDAGRRDAFRLALVAGALASAVASVGCSDSTSGVVTESRKISKFEEAVDTETTAADRFRLAGFAAPAPAPEATPGVAGGSSGEAASGGAPGGQLAWDAPEGWVAAPTSSMREANFTFGPDGTGECYVSRLKGAGGGLEANVNRWLKQMGETELSAEAIAALPTIEVLGQPATLVQANGSFTGMGGAATIEDAGLLGAIGVAGDSAVFVKMTGPREVVEANEDRFRAFCASLRLE